MLEGLDYVGVLCVELFLLESGELVVNEIAPRPHNSGHLTIDGHACCQFEQQVRAICGLPLGTTERLAPGVAMANLLGEVWSGGAPRWEDALACESVRLHLYGKTDPRPGRKMGHLTATAESAESGVCACARGARVVACRGSVEELPLTQSPWREPRSRPSDADSEEPGTEPLAEGTRKLGLELQGYPTRLAERWPTGSFVGWHCSDC